MKIVCRPVTIPFKTKNQNDFQNFQQLPRFQLVFKNTTKINQDHIKIMKLKSEKLSTVPHRGFVQ